MSKEERVIQKRTKREFVDYVLGRIVKEKEIDLTFWDGDPDEGETYAFITSDLFADGLSENHLPEMVSFGSYDRDCTSVILPHDDKDTIQRFLRSCLEKCNGDTIYTLLPA